MESGFLNGLQNQQGLAQKREKLEKTSFIGIRDDSIVDISNR